MAFDELYDEYEKRLAKALSMGGPDRLERRKNAGILNARERIDYLVDKGTWVESGLFTVSHLPEDHEDTPGDGKITGYGAILRTGSGHRIQRLHGQRGVFQRYQHETHRPNAQDRAGAGYTHGFLG